MHFVRNRFIIRLVSNLSSAFPRHLQIYKFIKLGAIDLTFKLILSYYQIGRTV